MNRETGMKWIVSFTLSFLLYYYLCYPTAPVSSMKISHAVDKPLKISKHDRNCFTQGLVIVENVLFESCGLYGKSSIRRIDLNTFQVQKMKPVPKEYFAEGLTYVHDLLFMLTWKNKVLFIYDPISLQLLDRKLIETHNGEGWGLTTDGKQLIVSDGSEFISFYKIPTVNPDRSSSNLYEVKPKNEERLEKIREIRVYDPISARGVSQINELEFVNGFIFANIWFQDIILQISPESGHIVERYDLSKLFPKEKRNMYADVLNGIAFNEQEKSFLVTGKLWSKYFHINFTKAFEERDENL
jgi:glutamine cyclotransferase